MNVNAEHTVWMEKYRPLTTNDLVLPEQIKERFNQFAKKQDIPNLGLWSANPGCVLPGTQINVQGKPELKPKKYFVKKYGFTKKDYSYLKSRCIVVKKRNLDYLDLNSIPKYLIPFIQSGDKFRQKLGTDTLYTNKYLKLDYWLSKLDIQPAIEKVSFLRKYKKYFEIDLTLNCWQSYKSTDIILRNQLILIYKSELLKTIYKHRDKNVTIDFWLWRGYTDIEAKTKISELHKDLINAI